MSDTIAAISTPLAVGGISVVRISGDNAIAVADKVFKGFNNKPLTEYKGYAAGYGGIYNLDGTQIDDGVALVFKSPKSYTGEDVVEISCHGGVFVTREVLRCVLECGARPAEAGEFSKRAFLNGKLTLTQAEAVMDLIGSQNEMSLRTARAQANGALFKRLDGIKEKLINIAAHLAAWVDFPEEDIEVIEYDNLLGSLKEAEKTTQDLLNTFDTGKIIREGVQTAIVGKPNVGKSTLMNLLSGCEKSIVTEIAGTTRDVVEESVNIGNAVLRLADTAGIRQTDDMVEHLGVEKAIERIKTAGLVLAVFDNSDTVSEQDKLIVSTVTQQNVPAIAIINKTDLPKKIDNKYISNNFKHIVYTSTSDKNSLKALSVEIDSVLKLNEIDTSSGIIANERQRSCAKSALGYIREAIATLTSGFTLDAVTVNIESAIESLLELSGQRVSEEVVNGVFHNFCVGK